MDDLGLALVVIAMFFLLAHDKKWWDWAVGILLAVAGTTLLMIAFRGSL